MNIHEFLSINKLDAIIVTNLLNIRYLTGFSGSNATFICTAKRAVVVTDFRYQEQIKHELAIEADIIIAQSGLDQLFTEILQSCNRIAFEGNYLTASQFNKYQELLSGKELVLENIDGLRIIKSAEEIVNIRQAADIANHAFAKLLDEVHIGMTELQAAAQLEFHMRSLGSSKTAFDTIVASGINSSMPHAQATDKQLANGDFVTIDFGAVYRGYHSDMTRTFVIGHASEQQKEVYNTVLRAQLAALEHVQTGIHTFEVDKAARDIITQAGYGTYFGHATGHGVGLQIHEEPRLSSTSTQVLQPGMIVTVEPGIYIPHFGGVRIEDLVVVTGQGHDVLTALIDKQLLEIY